MTTLFYIIFMLAVCIWQKHSAAQTTVHLLGYPAESKVCPGSKVTLTCIVTAEQHPTSTTPFLIWELQEQLSSPRATYRNGMPKVPLQLGDFATSAIFTNNYYDITSNATLNSASLVHNNQCISCFTYSTPHLTKCISVAGAEMPPYKFNATILSNAPLVLTLSWLPPSNCSFSYTVNITNSSSVTEQMYSNSTSLVLIDLTHGENYSFVVAVTDSTGQHGPWSEELRVKTTLIIKPNSSVPNATTTSSSFTTEINIEQKTSTRASSTVHSLRPSASTTNRQFQPIWTSSPLIKDSSDVEYANSLVYELAIAFTTGLIFISTASLIVAVCIIVKLKKRSSNWRRPIRDHQQANEPYLSTPTVVDVEYDVPIFTNNPAGKFQGNLQEDVHVDKNPAYEQICIYKNIPDQ